MSVTVTNTRISKDARKGRLAVVVDPADYLKADGSPKSGYFTVTPNYITASGSSGAGFSKSLMKFPFVDTKHGPAVVDGSGSLSDGTAYYSGGGGLGVTTPVYVAYNAGVPGPQARILPNGLIELWCHEIELPFTTTVVDGAMTLSLNYDLTFTEIDPTDALSSPTTGTLSVALANEATQDVDTLTAPSLSGGKVLVVRVTDVDAELGTGCDCKGGGGIALYATVPGGNGNPITLYSGYLADTKQDQTVTKSQWILAVNDGKLDQSAGCYRVAGGSNTFEILNVLIRGYAGGFASATVGYSYKLIT